MAGLSRFVAALTIAVIGLAPISNVPSSESVNYTYDALGRLVRVDRSGTVNNGTQTSYNYDSAGNRTSTAVTTPGSVCLGVGFSINDVTVLEGTPLVFTITRSGPLSIPCGVNYATANGSAVSPNDYGAVSGTLQFVANQAARTVSISTVIAGPNEQTEFMFLNLSSPTGGATLTDGQGRGTIQNNFDGCTTCLQSAPPPVESEQPRDE
jgi:YD repeat-containing protein